MRNITRQLLTPTKDSGEIFNGLRLKVMKRSTTPGGAGHRKGVGEVRQRNVMHVHQLHPARRKNPMKANPASGSACRWRSNPCEQRGDRLQSVGSLFVTEGIEAKRFPPPSAINTCWRHLGIHRFTHRSGVQQFPGRGRNENIVLLGRWRFGLTEVKRQIKPYGTTQVNGNRAQVMAVHQQARRG